MDNLYEVLRVPDVSNLHLHSITYFDRIVEKYPHDYKNIIRYINDCFNYHSPLIIEENDWGVFLMNRFIVNNVPEEMRSALMKYECEDIVFGIFSFLAHQKQPIFTTLIAKQNLRINMLATMQNFSATTADKKNANEMVSNLDIEINEIFEKMRQAQKVFGNFKGYDNVKAAINKFKINIANYIDQ